MKKGLQLDGEKVRAWRTDRGMSQAELAERAGLRRETVIRAEQGYTVSFATIFGLTEALGLDSPWMLDVSPERVRAGGAALAVVGTTEGADET
jgi:transcriptional regulator with XRE-family HTH domain